MKKKMKDLTEDEIQRVCDSHNRCADCPFGRNGRECIIDYLNCKIDVPEEEEK